MYRSHLVVFSFTSLSTNLFDLFSSFCFVCPMDFFQVINLVLSDIVGDPLDCIASGPTVHDQSTSQNAIQVINKYLSKDQVSESSSNSSVQPINV